MYAKFPEFPSERGLISPAPKSHVRANILERAFFIDNLLVRIHLIIEVIWRTGLAPWEFEFPVPGILISTFPVNVLDIGPRQIRDLRVRS